MPRTIPFYRRWPSSAQGAARARAAPLQLHFSTIYRRAMSMTRAVTESLYSHFNAAAGRVIDIALFRHIYAPDTGRRKIRGHHYHRQP